MHDDDDLAFFHAHGPDCSCGPVSADDRYWGADRDAPDPLDVACEEHVAGEVEHSDAWWDEAMALARVMG